MWINLTRMVILLSLSFIAGGIVVFMAHVLHSPQPKPIIKGGYFLIKKNEEAIDGQIRVTKDLWDICTFDQVTFKIKNVPGEPGDWEE